MKTVDKLGYILIYVAMVLWGTIIIITPIKIIGAPQPLMDIMILVTSFMVSMYISKKNYPNIIIGYTNRKCNIDN